MPAALEKGNRDRLLRIAPAFAEFLEATPERGRRGCVFSPKARRAKGPRPTAHRVGQLLAAIGEAAGKAYNRTTKAGECGKTWGG